jgi:hypothetical protein
MGEAKRRKAGVVVYHHTSSLRTNLMWMSGVIELEGRGKPATHPHLEGPIIQCATVRRAMRDFPAVAWFTSEIAIPNCLREGQFAFITKTGEVVRYEHGVDPRKFADATALQRAAIGFRLADCPTIVPWPSYYGYTTDEGRELNETARDVGDDPDRWFVSEQPVDLLRSVVVYISPTIFEPKLVRQDWYVKHVHNMVRMCREQNVYIAPSWMKEETVRDAAAHLGLKCVSADTGPCRNDRRTAAELAKANGGGAD